MVLVKGVNLHEMIFSKLSEYDLYRYYLGSEFKLNTTFKSPLHKDRNPSFSIGTSKSERLIWRDYSTDEKGGAIDLVERLYGITYGQALDKIAKDFGLMEGKDQHKKIISQYIQPVIDSSRSTLIQVTTKKMTKADIGYWGQYKLNSAELQADGVYSVKEWFLNRKKQQMAPNELCYAYHYEGKGFKIYMPERSREEGRWKSSISCSLVEGLEKLNGDPRVLITKSKKDKLTLQKIIPYPVINTQNEGISAYSEEFRELLKGRKVIINYDADEAGVKNCKKICDLWNYNYVNTPRELLKVGVKDISDWVAHSGGYDEIEQFLRMKGVIE